MNKLNEPAHLTPLAYLLTWLTYGTWLPGDDRGWLRHCTSWHPPDANVRIDALARMREDACLLTGSQRQLVESTIEDHCRIRAWQLFARNCRTNHVHVVVSATIDPDKMCGQFKAWCTRRLKELAQQDEPVVRENWWAERASTRYLNDEMSLEAAIRYVRDAQDTWRPHTNPKRQRRGDDVDDEQTWR